MLARRDVDRRGFGRFDAEVGGKGVVGDQRQGRVERIRARPRAEDAKAAGVFGVVGHAQAEDERTTGREVGLGGIGQRAFETDLFAETAVLDAGQVRVHAARVGGCVVEIEPGDPLTVEGDFKDRRPFSDVGLGVVLGVDAVVPIDLIAAGLGGNLHE